MADNLKDFLISIGFKVDQIAQRQAEEAVRRTEERNTAIAERESEKRRKIEAKEASDQAKERKKTEKEAEAARKKEDKEEAKREAARRRAEKDAEERRRKTIKEVAGAAKQISDTMAAVSGAIIGSKLFGDITNTAGAYSKLYMQSQRTGASPSKIAALMYGMKQMGVDGSQAESSFNGFVKALQEQPGLRHMLAGKGIRVKDANGKDSDPADMYAQLGTYFQSLPQNVALGMAGSMGIDQDSMISLEKQKELLEKIAEFGKIKNSFGLDPEKATDDGRKFTAAYDKLAADLHAIRQKVERHFFGPLTTTMKAFSDVLEGNGDVAVKFGDGFVALGALLTLRAIPPLFRLTKLLTGLTSIAMPAWLLEMLGLGGIAVVGGMAADKAKGVFDKGFNAVSPGANPAGMEENQSMGPLERAKKIWRERPAWLGGGGSNPDDLVKKYYGGRAGGGGSAKPTTSSGGKEAVTNSGSADNLTRLTEAAAREAGIDPRIMHGIRAGESGHRQNDDPRGAYDIGDGKSSFGPWQLHYGGINPSMPHPGLGDNFTRDTGLDARDPKTIPAQTRWVANYLKTHSPRGIWFGYHGNRDASPRWGDSGYVPEPQPVKTPFKAARKPLADAPNPYGALGPYNFGAANDSSGQPGVPKGLRGGGYMALGLDAAGRPIRLGGNTTNNSSRGDTVFTQHNHNNYNIHGDVSPRAIGEAVKASTDRGAQDHIRNLQSSSQ